MNTSNAGPVIGAGELARPTGVGGEIGVMGMPMLPPP